MNKKGLEMQYLVILLLLLLFLIIMLAWMLAQGNELSGLLQKWGEWL